MMKVKGKTYADRVAYQMDEWVKGNSIHNDVDDECCPDFSCCQPSLQQPLEVRKTFQAVYKAMLKEKHNSEFCPMYDAYVGMKLSFISAVPCILVNRPVYEKLVYIVYQKFNKN